MKKLLVLLEMVLSFPLFGQDIKEINKLIASERFEEAYTSLIQLKKIEPNNPFVYFSLGETVLKSYISDPYSDNKSNVIKKAQKFFLEGAKTDSLNPLSYVGLGIVELFKTDDTIKADLYFARANNFIPRKSKRLFGGNKSDISELQIVALLKLETAELYGHTPRFYKSDQYNKILVELRPLLADVYIAYGDIQLAQYNASEAIFLYKKALYLENTALTNYLIAKIYYLGRNNDEAIKCYEASINLDSTFAPAFNGLGDVYYKMKKNKLANMNYAHFIALAGNNISAKIHYVNTLYKAKDLDGTINIAEDILKADSSRTYLYRLVAYSYADKPKPDMQKALIYIRKFFSKAPEDELITKDYNYYSKILLSLRRDSNDIRTGVEMLEKAYLTDSSDNNALIDVIKESYHYKMYDIEIKYLSKKINSGNRTTNNYEMLGKAYYYMKSFHKADSIFALITTTDSLNLEAWKWRSNAMMSIDPDLKMGLAKPAFDKILKITSLDVSKHSNDRFEALAYLGSYYMFTSDIDLNKAIEYIKESIDLKLNNPDKELKAYYALGFAYYKSKQWTNAKMAYETVLKLKPDDIYAPKALNDINKYLSANK